MTDPERDGRLATVEANWLLFGLAARELYPDHPTDLSDQEFQQVVEDSRTIGDNMVAIAGGYGDATDLVVRGEAYIFLNGWEAMLTFAADKGVEADFGFFDTSTVVWCDSYILSKSAEDMDAAYALDQVIAQEPMLTWTNLIFGASNVESEERVHEGIRGLFGYSAVTDASDPRDVTNWLPLTEPDQGRAVNR